MRAELRLQTLRGGDADALALQILNGVDQQAQVLTHRTDHPQREKFGARDKEQIAIFDCLRCRTR